MKREHKYISTLPIPYVHCPFTQNANDMFGHLVWDNVNVSSYGNDGAAFNGTNYLHCSTIDAAKIKTLSMLVKYNEIPIDGQSATWQMNFVLSDTINQYRLFSQLQHFSQELHNDLSLRTYDDVGIFTDFGTTQTDKWYRISFRINTNGTLSLFIDSEKRDISFSGLSNPVQLYIGKHTNNIRYLKGNVKDLMIFDTILTDELIAQL